jgi:ATP-dependent RNA helicase DeaD
LVCGNIKTTLFNFIGVLMSTFSDLNLHPQLVQAVTERGYTEPSPIQSAMIPVMLTGADVVGQAQTGTGKTAAFALPLLHNFEPNLHHVQSLVMAPTRELALQVADAITAYGQFRNVRVLAVYGGQPYPPQLRALRQGVDVVVGTPGRLLDLIERGALDIHHVRTVVLDEADEMLSMGFIEPIEAILATTPETRQTALFSATMPAEIRRLADKYMKDPQSVTIQRDQVTGVGIEQRFYMVNEAQKTAALTRLFEIEEVTSALIFVRTRIGTGELANELTVRGFPAEALNGDLSQDARERTLNRFRQNQIKVLVATDVAARGLDIDDISHVFNFDLPDDPEVYVHRIGRTGRAGKAGIAISLVAPYERRKLRQVEAFARQKIKQADLPTEQDIFAHREAKLLTNFKVWLARGRCKRERELVEQLITEGHDPIELAAIALKMARAEDKQRPVAPVSVVTAPEPRPSYGGRNATRGWDERPARRMEREPRQSFRERGERPSYERSTSSHEAGMVRLSVRLGRQHGIRPNDLVGAIAFHADIPGNVIGKIVIEDNHSLVDVPEQFVGKVLAKAGTAQIRRQPLMLQKA